MDVVWDTGSGAVVVNEANCDRSCGGLVYNSESSSDFVLPKSSELGFKSYGTTYVEGYDVYDTVCLLENPDSCVSQFKWFANV